MKALIDADSILYLALPKKNNPDQTYEECCQEIDDRINKILLSTGSDGYVLFLTQGKCFRYKSKKASDDYKHSRQGKSMPPVFYALKEYMKQKHNAYVDTNLEADDLVCYFNNYFEEPTIICSPDKDVVKQTEGVHYDYKKNKRIATSKKDAEKFLFMQLGMGDPTDGIAGIQGVGEKTVSKWFDQLHEENNEVTYKNYASLLIEKYIDKYGIHEGINRYFETFTMVYMLKTEDDMMRELGYLPRVPEFNYVTTVTEESENGSLW